MAFLHMLPVSGVLDIILHFKPRPSPFSGAFGCTHLDFLIHFSSAALSVQEFLSAAPSMFGSAIFAPDSPTFGFCLLVFPVFSVLFSYSKLRIIHGLLHDLFFPPSLTSQVFPLPTSRRDDQESVLLDCLFALLSSFLHLLSCWV